jgi:hypothetical protein
MSIEKLKTIGYSIRPTCRNCSHGAFEDSEKSWGYCLHEKHLMAIRKLKISLDGWCQKHSWSKIYNVTLGEFIELKDE